MDAPPLTITTTQGTSQSTTRTGKDFYRELNYTNTSAAVSNTATITGTRSGPPVQTGTEQRPLFLPQTPESFDYDDDGNLTEDGRWIYTWDAENRLIAMETKTSIVTAFPGLKQRLEFAYDAQGRRIRKAVQSWDAAANNSTGDWVTVTDLRFVYDGWNLLTELDALNANSVVRSYAWGLDLSGSLQGAGGVGGLLWANTTTHSFAASADGNGNIVAWVNTASLAFAGRADYGAFGEPVMRTGLATALPFGFSSKYTDAETDLVYYGFRYYNPSTGRWPNRDPIGEKGGLNLYGMVGNDPVNLVDLLGLSTDDNAGEVCACRVASDVGKKKLIKIEYKILQGSLESQAESAVGKAGGTAGSAAAGKLLQIAVDKVGSTTLGKAAKSNYSTNYSGYRGKYDGKYRKCEASGSGAKWSDKLEFSGVVDIGSTGDFYATPEEALAGARSAASVHWNSL